MFKISELSNSRPLTAVAYTVFHERDLINQFKIPPTSLLALLLTLEEHYLTEVPGPQIRKHRNSLFLLRCHTTTVATRPTSPCR